ncbi:MAG: hypothetical protein WC095_01760 [Candidatus Paceibacterota bacterium]
MTFLVSIETPTRGSLTLGYVEIPHEGVSNKELKKSAQRKVIELLTSAGFELSKISIQVSDYTSLEIGIHRVLIIPIKEFNNKTAVTLATLLQ